MNRNRTCAFQCHNPGSSALLSQMFSHCNLSTILNNRNRDRTCTSPGGDPANWIYTTPWKNFCFRLTTYWSWSRADSFMTFFQWSHRDSNPSPWWGSNGVAPCVLPKNYVITSKTDSIMRGVGLVLRGNFNNTTARFAYDLKPSVRFPLSLMISLGLEPRTFAKSGQRSTNWAMKSASRKGPRLGATVWELLSCYRNSLFLPP